MNSKEIISELDEILAYLEDFTHGKDGDKITQARKLVSKLAEGFGTDKKTVDKLREEFQKVLERNISLYGPDSVAQEKATSFGVGFQMCFELFEKHIITNPALPEIKTPVIEWVESSSGYYGLNYSAKKGTYKNYTFDIRYDYDGNPKIKPECDCSLVIYFKNAKMDSKYGSIKKLTEDSEKYLLNEILTNA